MMEDTTASTHDDAADAYRAINQSAATEHSLSTSAVVTTLTVAPEYIVVGMDDGKLHIFRADGRYIKALEGHVGGVWATDIHEGILVSGATDSQLRVWNIDTL